jgi:hypothetical protein
LIRKPVPDAAAQEAKRKDVTLAGGADWTRWQTHVVDVVVAAQSTAHVLSAEAVASSTYTAGPAGEPGR